MEKIKLTDGCYKLEIKNCLLDTSEVNCASLKKLVLEDVSLIGARISHGNLSDLEIDGVQMGGAYIHNVGVPPKGHPAHDPDSKHQPLRFEVCDFEGSSFTNCNLANVELNGCNIKGMKINGVLVEEMMKERT
jgi:uncharacterized protein YjbI with pentapeptide repeats